MQHEQIKVKEIDLPGVACHSVQFGSPTPHIHPSPNPLSEAVTK